MELCAGTLSLLDIECSSQIMKPRRADVKTLFIQYSEGTMVSEEIGNQENMRQNTERTIVLHVLKIRHFLVCT